MMPGSGYFVIGGAQRSGTTLLHHLLDQHPQIEMAQPLRPEPRFFLRPDAQQKSEEEYRRELFPAAKTEARMFGEKSTSYMERSDAVQTMRIVLADVRLIFVLRDPVERAISNFRFSVTNGAETLPIGEAFRNEDQRRHNYDVARYSVSPFAYLARGRYCELLEPWERAIGKDRIQLILFEHLIRDAGVMQRLFHWLGVAEWDCPIPDAPINASRDAVDVPPELRRWVAHQFIDSNRRLAERYGLDLSAWQS